MACTQLVNKRRQMLVITGVGVDATVPTAADPCSVGWVTATDIMLGEWAVNFDYDGAGTARVWTRVSGGIIVVYPQAGGSGTPGTPVNAIQFNNPLGTFDGDSTLTYQTSGGLSITNQMLATFLHSTGKTGKFELNDNVTGAGISGAGLEYGDFNFFIGQLGGTQFGQLIYDDGATANNYVRVTPTETIFEADFNAGGGNKIAIVASNTGIVFDYNIAAGPDLAILQLDIATPQLILGSGVTNIQIPVSRGTTGQIFKENGTGGMPLSNPEFLDGIFAIQNTADPTKQADFDASGITPATTRTFTLPDQNGTLALTSDVDPLKVEQIDIFIEAPSVKTYTLRRFAKYAGTINDLTHIIGGGTDMTIDIEINGTNVTGLAALTVNTVETTTNATALNTFIAGDTIDLVVSAITAPTDAAFSLKITRS